MLYSDVFVDAKLQKGKGCSPPEKMEVVKFSKEKGVCKISTLNTQGVRDYIIKTLTLDI